MSAGDYTSSSPSETPEYDDYSLLVGEENSQAQLFLSVQSQIRTTFSYLHVATGVLVLIANLGLLVCFIKFRFLKRKPNIYIFSLCVSDFLAGIDIILLSSLNAFVTDHNEHTKSLCVFAAVFQYFTHVSSLFSMFCAALERYVHIVHPYTHARFSESKIHLVIIAVGWFILIGMMIILAYPNIARPGVYCYLPNVSYPKVYFFATLLTTLPQVIAITVLMMLILKVVLKHRRQITALDQLEMRSAQADSHAVNLPGNQLSSDSQMPSSHVAHLPAFKKVNRNRTNMVIFLIAVTLICWTPIIIAIFLRVLLNFKQLATKPWAIYAESTIYCLIINSLLNPFLYQRFSPDIKKAYRIMLNRGVPPHIHVQ